MKSFLHSLRQVKKSIRLSNLIIVASCLFFLLSSCKKELKADGPMTLTYDKVYLIGDATTAGWTIANALPMTKSADNATFIWTGPLAAGEIKFPTALSFSSDTFAAASASQSVSNNKAQLSPGGNPDVKWKLVTTEAGTYKITLDTKAMTVNFQKQ